MLFLFLFLATGLGIAAKNATGGGRAFLIICCLLNLAAAGKLIYTDDPYTFKLMPNEHSAAEQRR